MNDQGNHSPTKITYMAHSRGSSHFAVRSAPKKTNVLEPPTATRLVLAKPQILQRDTSCGGQNNGNSIINWLVVLICFNHLEKYE